MVIYLPLPPDREIEVFEDSVLQRTYRFTNRDMTREALQVCGPYSRQGNKVLALAGDALLRQILVDQGRERAKTPGSDPLINYKFPRLLTTITINRGDPECHHPGGLQ